MKPVPDREIIEAQAGHRFPGGDYVIAHWENFLLTQCTGAELLPDGLAHPIALFHLPIAGAGTSIAEMFELGRAESFSDGANERLQVAFVEVVGARFPVLLAPVEVELRKLVERRRLTGELFWAAD